jgi:hypothetical protein
LSEINRKARQRTKHKGKGRRRKTDGKKGRHRGEKYKGKDVG